MREMIIAILTGYAGELAWLKPLNLCTNEELLEMYTEMVQKTARIAAVGQFL